MFYYYLYEITIKLRRLLTYFFHQIFTVNTEIEVLVLWLALNVLYLSFYHYFWTLLASPSGSNKLKFRNKYYIYKVDWNGDKSLIELHYELHHVSAGRAWFLALMKYYPNETKGIKLYNVSLYQWYSFWFWWF